MYLKSGIILIQQIKYCVTALGKLKKDDKQPLEDKSIQQSFQRVLDHESMAEAVKMAMHAKGVSVRKLALATQKSTSTIHRIRVGEATIDNALEVLDELGYQIEMSLKPKGQ